jgi:PAS domain S-box-containing protein
MEMKSPKAVVVIRQWVGARLQRKIVLILALILLIISSLLLVWLMDRYQDRLIGEQARASLQVNQLLQASLENAMLKRDIQGLRDIVDKLGVQDGIVGAMILSPMLEIRFSSDSAHLGTIVSDPVISEALMSQEPRTSLIVAADGTELLRSVNPVKNREICTQCHGPIASNPINGLLIVDYDAASIKQEALTSVLILGIAGCLVVLATGFGIWIALHRLVVNRLHHMQRTARAFAAGQLDVRAHIRGADEIAELGSVFDRMAARLAQSLRDLNAAEAFLQDVIDAIPDGVRVIDRNFNIVKTNTAYCTQIGRSMAEVIGEKCYRSSHGRSEPCPPTLVSCPLAELSAASTTLHKSQHRQFHADGGELFVEVSAASVDLVVEGIATPCIVESIRDLAEQAKISQDQRLSEIGFLATGVAHEIHNPLSSIQLAVRAIHAQLEQSESNQQSFDYLAAAETEIENCLKVTDGLLRLSQPPGEERYLIALNQLIPSVLSLLSYQAEKEKIVVDVDLTPGLRVIAAESDMRMLVINLAQNAFHAMPNGGRLLVTGSDEGAHIRLDFKDDGVGIPARNQDKIFLPFWTKRASNREGRGLGLTICKAIIDGLDGTISVKSAAGQGACFSVTLPNADADND